MVALVMYGLYMLRLGRWNSRRSFQEDWMSELVR